MSFELFFACFVAGEPCGMPLAEVRALFPIIETESSPDYWSIRYDQLNSCNISIASFEGDPALVASLSVSRPCADPRLWDAILSLLRLGSVVLFFPGDAPPLVASHTVAAELPPDLIDALGTPRVVASGGEIAEIVMKA